ncbi:MAG: hypothetical protein N2109_05680 [Fimbriimonadales bacterium]|nr:hypothetical protein [Fimbriimonadales bacterium]
MIGSMRFSGKLGVFVALGSLFVGAWAQGVGPGQRPGNSAQPQQGQRGRAMQQVLEKLNLSPKQKQQVDKAREEWRKAVESARTEQDREKRRSKMREASRSFREKLDTILTAEQKKKLDAEMQKLRQQRGGPQVAPANAAKKAEQAAQSKKAASGGKK